MNGMKTILAVDDEAHILHVVSLKLQNAGFNVITANDAEEAFDAATGSSAGNGAGTGIDLLITDYQMPGMSGVELARKLHQEVGKKNLPVILLTAHGLAIEQIELAQAGINVCLSKPFSPRDLLAKVHEACCSRTRTRLPTGGRRPEPIIECCFWKVFDMSSTVLTTRSAQPNTAVLARLAERWRQAGLFLACLGRDGSVLWHDAQMPRPLALCRTADGALAQQIRVLAGQTPRCNPPRFNAADSGRAGACSCPWPAGRKLSAWIAILAPHRGDCRRAARNWRTWRSGRASMRRHWRSRRKDSRWWPPRFSHRW